MARSLSLPELNRQLASQSVRLDGLYLLAGDEPLLLNEAADSLRTVAASAGYTQRASFVLDAASDWSAVLAAGRTVSLFGDMTLLDLKLPGGKPGKTGSEALIQLAQSVQNGGLAQTCVLLLLPRLDKTTRASKWCSALVQAGTLVEIPAIARAALPQWIARRLAQQHQQLDADSLQWMADRVEGNLLAAHQEIMKLGLLYPQGHLTHEQVEQAVLDVARFDLNALRSAMLQGQPQRTLHVLDGLRAEGQALPLVLWAVTEELRALSRLSHAPQGRTDLMRQLRVFGPREALIRQALQRTSAALWERALLHAHDIDRLIKGVPPEGRLPDAWSELSRLLARIAISCARPAKQPA